MIQVEDAPAASDTDCDYCDKRAKQTAEGAVLSEGWGGRYQALPTQARSNLILQITTS